MQLQSRITTHLPKSDINSPVDTIMKGQNKEKHEKKNIVVGSFITVKVRDMDISREEEIIRMVKDLVVCVEA